MMQKISGMLFTTLIFVKGQYKWNGIMDITDIYDGIMDFPGGISVMEIHNGIMDIRNCFFFYP